jgi:hypothetical protein
VLAHIDVPKLAGKKASGKRAEQITQQERSKRREKSKHSKTPKQFPAKV